MRGIAILRHGYKRYFAIAMAINRHSVMSEFRDRIKEAADRVGGLNKLAELIGMPRRTLGDQLAGKTEPKMSLLVDTARVTGYRIEWLATGNGAPTESPKTLVTRLMEGLSRQDHPLPGESSRLEAAEPSAHMSPIDTGLLERLLVLVKSVHDEHGIKLPGTKATAEAAALYNDLLMRVSDLKDRDEIEANLPLLRYQLKKRLHDAAAAPGTGKRRA